MVVLRDIEFESHCEHHMAPIIGRAHVGYLPDGKVVGISKLARVVDVYARRFQVQEKMTAQIAHCINDVLQPAGVGVVIEAAHECMTTRGIHKRGVWMVTSKMLGTFRDDARTRAEFLPSSTSATAADRQSRRERLVPELSAVAPSAVPAAPDTVPRAHLRSCACRRTGGAGPATSPSAPTTSASSASTGRSATTRR